MTTPGTRRPTVKDVAALAGVSMKTVSRVINEEPLVREELVARVTAAIESLNYRVDQGAGSLRRSGRRSQTIGVVVSSIANPFAAAVDRAIENAAVSRNVAVLAASIDDDPRREQETVEALLRRRVDGLIITAARDDQSYLLVEQSFGTPFVFVDREPTGIEADAVVSDHATGAALATRHLLEHGHRRIAFLGDRSLIQSARERLRGFREELARSGIPLADSPAIMDLHDDAAAARVAIDLLSGPDAPTAIVSGQNLVTIGAVRALRRLDLHHAVALVGFDDLPLAEFLEPGITVVAQNPELIGRRAAEILFDRMDDGDTVSPVGTHVIPTVLIQRGSGEIAPVAR